MIDLDLVPPTRPAGTGRRYPATPRVTRPVAIAALVLTVLLALGGASPAVSRLRLVLTVGGSVAAAAFAVGPTALFTAMWGSDPNGPSQLRRYALAKGSPKWMVQAPQNVQGLYLAEAAQVLIASSGTGPDVAFIDAGTGRTLWRSTGVNSGPTAVTDTGVLSVLTDGDGNDAAVGRRAELRMADLRTGRTLWSRDIPPDAYLSTSEPALGPPTRAVLVTTAGRATVLDLADGTEVGTADLQLLMQGQSSDGTDDLTELTSIDNRLYVLRRVAGVLSISAHSGDDLRLRWRVTGHRYGALTGCGDVVCINSEDTISALDVRDGSLRWTDRSRNFGFALDVPGARPHPHRVLATSHDKPELTVLDAATGELRQRLGDGKLVNGLVLRSDTVTPNRTWVTVVDADGTFHTVGALELDSTDNCSGAGEYLACPTPAGPPSVWQVRGPARGARPG